MSDRTPISPSHRARLAAWISCGPILPLITIRIIFDEAWAIKALQALAMLCLINGTWFSIDRERLKVSRILTISSHVLGILGVLIALCLPFYVGRTSTMISACGVMAYVLACTHLLSLSWHLHRGYGASPVLAVLLPGTQFGLIAIGADSRTFVICALFACLFGFWAALFVPFWKRLHS